MVQNEDRSTGERLAWVHAGEAGVGWRLGLRGPMRVAQTKRGRRWRHAKGRAQQARVGAAQAGVKVAQADVEVRGLLVAGT